MLSLFKEFFEFLKERKKFWLLPIFVLLFLLAALLVFSQGSLLSPFIYSLF